MNFLKRLLNRGAVRSSIHELTDEVWIMDERRAEAFFNQVAMAALQVFRSAEDIRIARAFHDETRTARKPYAVQDGCAHIPVAGVIMKEVPCMFAFLDIAATSTEWTRFALREAVQDPDVSSIMLDIDSPGGTISGTAQLAEEVRAAGQEKPVHAHADDLIASAAYWIGAQANRLTAFETSDVGSIGVYVVVDDSSQFFEENGVKVHRIRSGPKKGIGVDGVPITKDEVAHLQTRVDKAAAMFVDAVAEGRGLKRADVERLATGEAWYGPEAHDLGLIDAVENVETAHANAHAAGQSAGDEPETAPDDGAPEGGGTEMPKPNTPAVAPAADDTPTPAPSATEERTELEQLQAELAAEREERRKAEARASMTAEHLASAKKARLATVLDEHQARGAFDASERAKWEKAAEAYLDDTEGLAEFLSSFPSRDAKVPKGGSPPPSAGHGLSPEQAELAQVFQLKPEEMKGCDREIEIPFPGPQEAS